MRICCQLPISMPESSPAYGPYYQVLRQDYELVKRPDTEVVIRDVPTGLPNPDEITFLGPRWANEREILNQIVRAEAEGFDAVAGACYFDCAIDAAKQLCEIPVVGPAEASMHLACQMGNKFAAISSDARWVPAMEHRIGEVGLRESAIDYRPMRALTMPPEQFFACLAGDFGPAIEDFKQVARGCIADGAEVLVVACGLLSPALTLSGVTELDGVPVIDSMLVSLKMAELLVDYRRANLPTKSKAGLMLSCACSGVDALASLGAAKVSS